MWKEIADKIVYEAEIAQTKEALTARKVRQVMEN